VKILARFLMLLVPLACAPENAAQSTGVARYETVVSGLYVPWAMAFAPDGRVFVTERPGRIRVVRDWKLETEPWATLDVVASGESGLMGIALSPGFARDHHVYVVATVMGGNNRLINRVIRFTERDGRGAEPHVLIDNIPAAELHAGDAIAFGPDGMLYVATGDITDAAGTRGLTSLTGKILRYTQDGGIPADNPFPNSPVYAQGVRNPQGLAWNERGDLFATDHGPSGFPSERLRRNHDELNAIVKGRHYGWPEVAGMSSEAEFVPPLTDWSPAIAPSGLAIYKGPHAPWRGNAFVGGLRGRQLRRIAMERSGRERNGWRVTGEQALFEDDRDGA
jgi:aldose sugar dehydrogenase